MKTRRILALGALNLALVGVAGCPRDDKPSLDEKLPDRLLNPTASAPDPVHIPTPPPPPPPPDPGPLPPPKTGDPAARAVVLGRADAESVVKKDAAGALHVGPIEIAADRKSMKVPARINQRQGIIEYMAVGPKGKTHESVLVLETEGTHLMVGCLLLGLTPAPLKPQEDPGLRVVRGGQAASKAPAPAAQADPAPPELPAESNVRIEVEWLDPETKKAVRHRAEELTWNRELKASMRPTDWVFTGSSIWRGNFVAELEQSYIATWPDRSALFNNPWPSKNPYRGAGGYEANKKLLPPPGTKATVTISKSK